MLFENVDMICAEHDQRQLATLQVLLIFEALIGGHQDVEAVIFGGL